MAFIEKLVGPDEKLIGIARLHWIYGVTGLCWLGGMILLGGAFNWALKMFLGSALLTSAGGGLLTIGNAAFWICLLLGGTLFLFYFIMMLATEIGLTDRRVIYKTGLVLVKTEGIDLEEIKGVFVDNEVFGRILNYGTIKFDSRFIQDLQLPTVADPYRFVKALNDQRSKMKDEGIHLVVEEDKRHTVANQLEEKLEQSPPQPTPSLEDRQYKTLDNLDPLGVLDDIAQETQETRHHVEAESGLSGKPMVPLAEEPKPKAPFSFKPGAAPQQKTPPHPAPEEASGPIVFAELKEGVMDEFADSTRH